MTIPPVDKTGKPLSANGSEPQKIGPAEEALSPAKEILQQKPPSEPAKQGWLSGFRFSLWSNPAPITNNNINDVVEEEEEFLDFEAESDQGNELQDDGVIVESNELPAEELLEIVLGDPDLIPVAPSLAKKGTSSWAPVATRVATRVANSYFGTKIIGSFGLDKNRKSASIKANHDRIQTALRNGASGYIEFSKAFVQLVLNTLENSLSGDFKEIYLGNREALRDLLEVNITKGFANLAEQVAIKGKSIPNYDPQAALVNITSVLFQKIQSSPTIQNADGNTFYSLIADEIMSSLFPNKLRDLEMGKDWLLKAVDSKIDINKILQTTITNLLKDTPIVSIALKNMGGLITKAQNLHAISIKLITDRKYKNEKEIISISEKLTDLVLQAMPKTHEALPVEEWLETLAPGIKLDKNLVAWFKDNLIELETSKQVKEALGAIILLSMDRIIQANFSGNSEEYAAALVKKFNEAAHLFKNPSPEQKVELTQAYETQDRIEHLEKRIETAQKELDDNSKDLLQNKTFKALLGLKRKELNVADRIQDLEHDQMTLFTEIIESSKKRWSWADIPDIRAAFDFRATIANLIEINTKSSGKSELQYLEEKLGLFQEELRFWIGKPDFQHNKVEGIEKNIKNLETLIHLIKMGPQKLPLFTLVLAVNNEIEAAKREKENYADQIESLQEEPATQKDLPSDRFEKAVIVLKRMDTLHTHSIELKRLEAKLDSHLGLFQRFSRGLLSLGGLDEAHFRYDTLELPFFVKDPVWKQVESFRQMLPRLLFKQMSKPLRPLVNKEANQAILSDWSGSNDLNVFISSTAKSIVGKTLENLSDAKKFAKAINDAIPGAESAHLQGIFEVELKKIITSDKAPFTESRQVVAEYIESLLLNLFVGIANKESYQSILTSLTKKLAHLPIHTDLIRITGQTPEDITRQITALEAEIAQLEKEGAKSKIREIYLSIDIDLTRIPKVVIDGIPKTAPMPAEIAKQIAALEEKSAQAKKEIARAKILEIMRDDLAISSPADLEKYHIPAMGQQSVFDLLTNQLLQQVEPILLPMIDKSINYAKIHARTGSTELGQFAGQATRNILNQIPSALGSYRDISLAIFESLAGREASEDEAYRMTEAVNDIVKQASKFPVSEEAILHAYEQAIGVKKLPDREEKRQLLVQRKAVDEIKGVVMSLEDIAKKVALSLDFKGNLIGLNIFKKLADRDARLEEQKMMNNAILDLVGKAKDHPITNEAILNEYEKVFIANLTEKEKAARPHAKLTKKERAAKLSILKESLFVEELVRHTNSVDVEKEKIEKVLRQVVGAKDSGRRYEEASAILEPYIEGMMQRLFLRIAEKNPPVVDANGKVLKGSIVVIFEKIKQIGEQNVKKAKAKLQEANVKKEDVIKDFAKGLNDNLMVLVAGIDIDSDEALAGMPLFLQKMVHDQIKDLFGTFTKDLVMGLESLIGNNPRLQEQIEQSKEIAKNQAGEACAYIIADDIAAMSLQITAKIFGEKIGDNTYGTNLVAKLGGGLLEDFPASLRTIVGSKGFKDNLDTTFVSLAKPDENREIKGMVEKAVGKALFPAINNAVTSISEFGVKNGDAVTQKMMAGAITAIAEHLELRAEAKGSGSTVEHRTFIEHAKLAKKLHPAVPQSEITYEKSIETIGNLMSRRKPLDDMEKATLKTIIVELMEQESKGAKIFNIELLMDKMKVNGFNLSERIQTKIRDKEIQISAFIREEAAQHQAQRVEKGYLPIAKPLMKMMFPNGQEDLYFIQPALRGTIWKLLKTSLFPMILQMVAEMLLDKNMVTQMVISSLEATRDNLSGKMTASVPVETNPLLTEAAAKLLTAIRKDLKGPELGIFNSLFDSISQNPILNANVAEAVGNTLTGVFNSRFFKEKLATALQSATTRRDGKPLLSADLRAKEIIDAEKSVKPEQLDKTLKKVTREVADVIVTLPTRKYYFTLKTNFTNWVNRVFGNMGFEFVNACIALFEYIFFKVFSILMTPISYALKLTVKEYIFSRFKIDENINGLIDMLTTKPEDQPGRKDHPVYHENMLFNVMEAIRKTVEEEIDAKFENIELRSEHKLADA